MIFKNKETVPIENSKELLKSIIVRILENEKCQSESIKNSRVYLAGIVIWDVFSNNNEVLSKDRKLHDIGSWRASGEIISEVIVNEFNDNRKESYSYIDFYLGSSFFSEKEQSFNEFYKSIFELFKELDCKWLFYSNLDDVFDDSNMMFPIIKSYKDVYLDFPERINK